MILVQSGSDGDGVKLTKEYSFEVLRLKEDAEEINCFKIQMKSLVKSLECTQSFEPKNKKLVAPGERGACCECHDRI